ncbi:hypothetical protein LJPFL01_3811 [Lelliottia jeotgali]|nr:hypothetical protein LJPFL01_3811 [Lelliottia jeotgali]
MFSCKSAANPRFCFKPVQYFFNTLKKLPIPLCVNLLMSDSSHIFFAMICLFHFQA